MQTQGPLSVCYTALTSPLAHRKNQNPEAVFAVAKLNVSVCSVRTWSQTPHCPYNPTPLAAQVHQSQTSHGEWPLTHSISKAWLLFER